MFNKQTIAAYILLAASANAVLPPGYEDDMWCPKGYCDKNKDLPEGFVGPASAFHECYDPSTGNVVDGVWTGSLSDTKEPTDWDKNPESCPSDDSDSNNVSSSPLSNNNNTMPGSDRDEHGCIPSAGYSWCESLQECIRPWETTCPDLNANVASSLESSAVPSSLSTKMGAVPGSDRDEHGCIPSAGYNWCEPLQECVRPWETICPDDDANVVSALLSSAVPTSSPTAMNALGSDRDEHGCIPSAGYNWCESLQECVRPWETPCPVDDTNLVSLSSSAVPSSSPTLTSKKSGANMLGSDRDEHGCIPSAGYEWCEALQECIRSWETSCSLPSSAPSSTASITTSSTPSSSTSRPNCDSTELYCPETNACIDPISGECPVAGGQTYNGPASFECNGSGRCDASECSMQYGGWYLTGLAGNQNILAGCTMTCDENCSDRKIVEELKSSSSAVPGFMSVDMGKNAAVVALSGGLLLLAL